MIPAIEKSINGCYTRMLIESHSMSPGETNEKLYGCIPKVTQKIRSRRLATVTGTLIYQRMMSCYGEGDQQLMEIKTQEDQLHPIEHHY